MSAYLESTSAVLGEYMLKGWTMTDLVCHHCRTTPLMREPTAEATAAGRSDAQRIQFCGRCDGSPHGSSSSAEAIAAPVQPVAIVPESASESTGPSAADRAANDISTLLLQGYSLLGTNCPAPTCQGIPLVGYPKSKDGKRDPRKRCVGCGQGYVDEKDAASVSAAKVEVPEVMSPRSKRRRELYAEGEKVNKAVADAAKASTSASVTTPRSSAPVATTTDDDIDMDDFESKSAHGDAISKAQASLSRTLIKLSESLDEHTNRLSNTSNTGPFFIELKLHTEAISDICSVLKTLDSAK